MKHPNNKYFKISIWLSGGGKITKETDAKNIDELAWIIEEFKDSIGPSYSRNFIMLDNCLIKCNDISAIDIEQKTDPLNC